MDEQTRQQIKDNAEMWCDLWMAERRARSAHYDVTRRAAMYVRLAGLPVEKVLDALEIDPATWAARLEDLEAWRNQNRAAAEASKEAA